LGQSRGDSMGASPGVLKAIGKGRPAVREQCGGEDDNERKCGRGNAPEERSPRG